MKQRMLLFALCLTLSIGLAVAQTSTVRGVVTSSGSSEPVVGASVLVVGTSIGAITDVNGQFTIANVPASAKRLRVTYVGSEPQEVAIRQGQMSIVLQDDARQLDEVVVTAMGITRSEKSLGYSATSVDGEDLVNARTTNVADALSGKVAGVTVTTTSSDPGSVSNIVIRGFGSINGSNQPLYVVDGVPMENNVVSGLGKNIAASGVGNIAAEDIASMTVLKGAAATALYGSRAANGVIVITTKNGETGDQGRNYSITYSGNVQAKQVSLLPEMQNSFGQGWNGRQTYIENGSWGPALDGSTQVYGPIWNNSQLIHQYSAKEDNVKDFFDIGISHNHTIALSGVSDDKKMEYYASYSYTSDDGIMPEDYDTYKRNTLAFRGAYQANDWLKVSSSVNLATSSTDAVSTYQGASVIDGVLEQARDVSIVDMKNTSSAFFTPEAYYTPYGITNPYWALENNYNHTDAKQVYGKLQLDITPIKPLRLTYRFGFDYSDYDTKRGQPKIDLDDALINEDYGYAPSNMNQAGYVISRYNRRYELNHDFIANYDDKFLDDRLSVLVNAGLNVNERYNTYQLSEADDLTFASDFWDLSNGSTLTTMTEAQEKRRLVGLFGDVTLGWDDMVYLNLTARNDWSSTLPKDNNSFFYPGATLSWIFTRLLPENDILTFGKARLAYGQTGNDADPYLTSTTYLQAYAHGYYGNYIAQFPMNGVNAFMKSNTVGSSALKPEMTTEFEAGLNLQFFHGRLGLDFTFYNRETDDQIFTLPVDPASGYSYMVTNFGKVRNRGIELLINTTPIKTRDFRWDLSFNFAKNDNEVVSLPDGLDGGRVSIYSFAAGNDAIYMYAEVGKPLGEYYTYLPQYTEDGKVMVGEDGLPILSSQVMDTGKNMNHDWTGGINTAFTYKGFTLSAQLDIRKGGYMFSRTKNLMQFTGNSVVTTYNERRPFIIPNSVVVDDAGNVIGENTTPIYQTDGTYQTYFNDYGYGNGGEAYLIDRSFVKLRNISLTWQLPKRWVRAIALSDVKLTLYCNNVFTWTASDNYDIDPETTTISQAVEGDLATQFGELYANPSCRTYGCNLSIKF